MSQSTDLEFIETEQNGEGGIDANETPLNTPDENPVNEPAQAAEEGGTEDVLAALDAVDVGEDTPPESANTEVKTGKDVEAELSAEGRRLVAEFEAAAATGAVATAVERVLNPVIVTDEMRVDFKDALVPVLMNSGGVMPEWMAKIYNDWKAELELAKKTVFIGYAIWEQHRDIKAGKLEPVKREKKRYRLPSSATTKTADKVAA